MSAVVRVGKVWWLRALGYRDIAAVERPELGGLTCGRRAQEQLEFYAADGDGRAEVGDGSTAVG